MVKNILITGSSHGIGAAAAVAFAGAGYDVGVNYYKDCAGAEETAGKVRELGRKAEIYRADVSSAAECEEMLEKFIADFGKIDVLVNNAGGALKMPDGGFENMPVEYWDSQVNLNLNAAAYCSRIAVRDMLAKKTTGRIINVSSVHGRVTYVKRKALPYCAAKAGLDMFTKSLGAEVAQYGINVNCIAPGFIMTKVSDRYSRAEMAAFKRKIPVGDLGRVEDITPMLLLLADVEKSRFIVGQTFVIDGGQSIDGVIDYMLQS
ncbi:MAG: SDR family NAD(P)-dependent oxidoreductase [Victivallales bacterium]|nr:SDR family NAD(P)-dependent oxidoreductase [Victivallales bacterium]